MNVRHTWHKGPMVGMNLETTARDKDHARILVATVVLVDGRTGRREEYSWVSDPGIGPDDDAVGTHGITAEYVRCYGAAPRAALQALCRTLLRLTAGGTNPIVSYKCGYDFTVLTRECARHGVPAPVLVPFVDPYVLASHVASGAGAGSSLGGLAQRYRVKTHCAGQTGKATVALRLAYALAETHPGEFQVALPVLTQRQVAWERERRHIEAGSGMTPGATWPVAAPADTRAAKHVRTFQ